MSRWEELRELVWGGGAGTVASLPGPSRTITVEPIEVPSEQPAPAEEPAPVEEPAEPVKEPEKIPA